MDPRACNQTGTQPPGRWDNADRSTATAPQSKPVGPASRLVAHAVPLVAFGLGLRISGRGASRLTDSTPIVERLCAPNPKIRRNCPEAGELAAATPDQSASFGYAPRYRVSSS